MYDADIVTTKMLLELSRLHFMLIGLLEAMGVASANLDQGTMAKSSREDYVAYYVEEMNALKKEEEEEFLRMLEPTEEIKYRKTIEEGHKVHEMITQVILKKGNNSNGEPNQDDSFLDRAVLEEKKMQDSIESLNQPIKK
jgi:hypothetical protein